MAHKIMRRIVSVLWTFLTGGILITVMGCLLVAAVLGMYWLFMIITSQFLEVNREQGSLVFLLTGIFTVGGISAVLACIFNEWGD